ncbi:MAG: protein kinase [Planctomycetota bacterium]|nr:protein kinase [Planctomycetota bacterium]MCX8040420.1 protein kinase [Planctomycetota bacterium]MDW8373897.1 protein kinase [Planctomycetota bacterium]
MTGTDQTAAGQGQRRASLGQRLAAATPIILANGWAVAHQIERAQAAALSGNHDHLSVGRFLVDLQVLTREQAAELDEILQQQTFFPDYLLLRKLGSGGMGTVYLAEHGSTGQRVALKTINARLAVDHSFIGRFRREVEALRRVHHPNIAAIYDSGVCGACDGHCWLAMEYIDGPNLMHLLRDYHVLPEVYSLRIIRQIAEGLAHVWNTAHLVHRDIKPENILIIRSRSDPGNLFPDDDQAKLIDFGLVKGDNADERLTQTGMTIGTPLYMSPEQVRGENLDCRSDIYGLSATLYHLLTGATPFTGSSPGAIMSAHLTEPVPDPGARVPALTEATRRLIMTGMAKGVDERFRSFEAMIAAIDDALEQAGAKNAGGMRLLRKPLVLSNKVPRKSGGTERFVRAAGTERIARPNNANEAAAAAPTERIVRSDTQRVARAAAPEQRSPEPPAPAPTSVPTEPLRTATVPATPVSAPDQRPSPAPSASGELQHPSQAAAPSAPAQPVTERRERSKVFDEDPHQPLSIGLIPWLVLAAAVLALCAYLLLFAW